MSEVLDTTVVKLITVLVTTLLELKLASVPSVKLTAIVTVALVGVKVDSNAKLAVMLVPFSLTSLLVTVARIAGGSASWLVMFMVVTEVLL